jgi:hypothetical protein
MASDCCESCACVCRKKHVAIEDVCRREPTTVLVENVKKTFENAVDFLDLVGVGQRPDSTYNGRIRLFDLHKKE